MGCSSGQDALSASDGCGLVPTIFVADPFLRLKDKKTGTYRRSKRRTEGEGSLQGRGGRGGGGDSPLQKGEGGRPLKEETGQPKLYVHSQRAKICGFDMYAYFLRS